MVQYTDLSPYKNCGHCMGNGEEEENEENLDVTFLFIGRLISLMWLACCNFLYFFCEQMRLEWEKTKINKINMRKHLKQ
jgi:hypothetical protein